MTKKKPKRAPRDPSATRYRNAVRLLDLYLPPLSPLRLPLQAISQRPNLRPLEDRRTRHPERWGRPVMATVRSATRPVVKPSIGPRLSARLQFSDPRRVIVCLRRKERREVIHALGKSGGGNRPRTRKPTSEISC